MPYLDRLVQQQGHLEWRLSQHPNYQREMDARGPMHDLVIRVKKSYEFAAREFDRRELDRFSERMREYLSWPDPLKYLAEDIEKMFAAYEALGEYGYGESDRRHYEARIVGYVLLQKLTQGGQSLKSLREKLKLEEGHIDYIAEEETWGPSLEAIEQRMPKQRRDIFYNRAKKILGKWETRLKGHDSQWDSGPTKFSVDEGETIYLEEVHPYLAVLRGFVGNDCATDVSFGFPYSPFERTYYVRDARGNFLGYVCVSLVEFRGKRSLFFHTIAGPGITHPMADMIIRGFYAARETIGGHYMTMPEDHRIGENINFRPIEEMMRKAVKGVTPERVNWLDGDYRRIIMETGSSAFYDSPERNHSARLVETSTDNLEVTTTSRPYVFPEVERPEALARDYGCSQVVAEYRYRDW